MAENIDFADGSLMGTGDGGLRIYLDPFKNESDFTREMAAFSEGLLLTQYIFSVWWIPGIFGYLFCAYF